MRVYLTTPRSRLGSLRTRHSVPTAVDADRKGSVLLVVIGLLGMLLLVGIAFYSFATQEQAASQYYSEAAKGTTSGLTTDKLWDFALQQLILGTNDTNKRHSALWGRRHALLTGAMGRTDLAAFDGFDLTPFNGKGINLQYSTAMGFVGDPYIDQNFNQIDDYTEAVPPSVNLLNINFSAAANGGTQVSPPISPAPDVDYSAPDINSLPLAFIGRGLDTLGNDVNVIIPSFHRPQLLRQNGQPIPNWQSAASTPQRVMRPHPNHMCAGGGGFPRFLSAAGVNSLGQTVNPFPFGTAATLQQGVWDLTGAVTPPVGSQTYSWDVDNDGDGVKEGIWMDLDYPVQSLSDGRKYVPLFSFTVTDADGLINLNISGNQAGLSNAGLPLAGGRHVSRSNQGLSRAEISPAWAMLANPATDPASTTQHNLFWNTAAGSISRTEMANIETLFLNIGRPDFEDTPTGTYTVPMGSGTTYEPTKYYSGRYGELTLMAPNSYTMSGKGMAGYGDGAVANRDFTFIPQAGRSSQMYGISGDDDTDNQFGHSRTDNAGYFFLGSSFLSLQSNVAVPSFMHPLDFFGSGVNTQAGATGLRTQLYNSGLPVPTQWPYYANGYSSPGTDVTGSGFVNYLNAGAGNLMASSVPSQIDEADEIIAEWDLATTNQTMLQDDVFGPDNMVELQVTDADLTTTNLQARVRDLAPYNFKLAANAEAIRHQFTVLSHDRKNFGLSPYVIRSWEFNADSDNDGNYEFPPAFVSPTGTTAMEPFRQVLRQLYYVELNQTVQATSLTQLRLNLNRFLSRFDNTNAVVGAPVYRELTAHPAPSTTLANTPIVAPTWNADSPSGAPTANDQEWWARRDRQLMARDLYVMLYTLGGGQDATSYTTSNAANQLYTAAQMKEMAQFAVNVVDELDRDDVITKFEYDKNLADGWNLTDDAYDTTDSSLPDHGVVYGVEAQKLTLSELLGAVSKKVLDSSNNGIDHPSTQVNDGEGDRYYTYMELRNASPFSVDLSKGAWQIAVQRDNGPDGIPNSQDETDVVQLTPYRASTSASSTIAPGATFTIGTRGGPAALDPNDATKNLPSIFRVEYTTGSMTPDFSTEATVIAPLSSTALNLDLIPTNAGALNVSTQFRISDGSASILGSGADVTTAGNFLYGANGPITGNVLNTADPLIFVLRRRANLHRQMPVIYDTTTAATHIPQTQDNPWVEVDRMTMTWREFQLQQDMSADEMARATTVQGVLSSQSLRSMERAQPFSRNLQENAHASITVAPYKSHTMGGTNSNSPGAFSQVQLHFDRDFASTIDLLGVPLYGPDEVTRRVGQPAKFDNSATGLTSFLAQERFLRPQHYENLTAGLNPATIPSSASAASDIKNNRWYRILELLEVPTQTEQGLRTYPYALRSSGAINLNTVRTRGVLAGVIDDPDNPSTPAVLEGHHTPQYASENVMLVDQYEPSGTYARDWWLQFLASRDGIDPITGLILPGTPEGRPFRSLTFSERSSTSLEDTVLRSLPLDVIDAASNYPKQADRRTLFEARTISDRPSSGGSDQVDPMSRHRLLRKVANNTTTRSNVFIVWITTRNFEAIQQTSGEVQIGDALSGSADHRGFFVIDRSLPENAYDSNFGLFDFRKFIQYRKTIQ